MTNIKDLREKAVLSQRDLAMKAGLSPNTINRLEKGKQKPTFVTARKLAKALDVKPGDIDFPS